MAKLATPVDGMCDKKSQNMKGYFADKAKQLNAEAPKDLSRPLNYLEQEALQALFAFGEFTDNLSSVLAPRLAVIPRARQRVGLMRWAARSLFRDVLEQMTDDAADRFVKTAQVMRCEVRPVGVSKVPREHDETIVKCSDLYVLTEHVYRQECVMCDRHGKEVKRCKLKKTLDNMMILTAHEAVNEGGCWYQL